MEERNSMYVVTAHQSEGAPSIQRYRDLDDALEVVATWVEGPSCVDVTIHYEKE